MEVGWRETPAELRPEPGRTPSDELVTGAGVGVATRFLRDDLPADEPASPHHFGGNRAGDLGECLRVGKRAPWQTARVGVRCRVPVARQAHYLEVGGSTMPAATGRSLGQAIRPYPPLQFQLPPRQVLIKQLFRDGRNNGLLFATAETTDFFWRARNHSRPCTSGFSRPSDGFEPASRRGRPCFPGVSRSFRAGKGPACRVAGRHCCLPAP